MRSPLRILPALLGGSAALLAGRAEAAECSSLGLPHVVYAIGSSAVKSFIGNIGQALALHSPPVTLIYVSSGSCTGVEAVLSAQTPITAAAASANPPTYWTTSGAAQTCDITTPVQADVGISDVFAQTCLKLPNGLGSVVDNLGPVQAMTFAVPKASTQLSISAEAAYMVFGFGNGSGVAPWVDETSFFVRASSSGTLQMLAAGFGVSATQWKGIAESNSDGVVAALNMANAMGGAAAEKAIGILSADVADKSRLTIRELAYKHYGQNCGYLPDSAPGKLDKRNVRDGHYAVWGPIHLLQRTDIDLAEQQYIKLAIDYVTGAQQPPGLDVLALEATNYVVPQCAMRVQRSQEVGMISTFKPTNPCGCYFEYVANSMSVTPGCNTCTTPADCSGGAPCVDYGGVKLCEP